MSIEGKTPFRKSTGMKLNHPSGRRGPASKPNLNLRTFHRPAPSSRGGTGFARPLAAPPWLARGVGAAGAMGDLF